MAVGNLSLKCSTHFTKLNATFTWSLWLLTLPAVMRQHDNFLKTALTYSVSPGLFCVLPAPQEKKDFQAQKHDTVLTNCSHNELFTVSHFKAFRKPLNICICPSLCLLKRSVECVKCHCDAVKVSSLSPELKLIH